MKSQIIGKIFPTEAGWCIRVSVDGGTGGKHERGPYPTVEEAARIMTKIITKLESFDLED